MILAVIPRPGVQDRILLHLRDFSEYSESIEVPFAISQMGIANAVSIARSNVPRAIAGLKEEGILIERQLHLRCSEKESIFSVISGWNMLIEYTRICFRRV